jgi:hypothetical protein
MGRLDCKWKGYIDQEMLTILGQMDSPTLIKDYLYLGSEWNASNIEELTHNGWVVIAGYSKGNDKKKTKVILWKPYCLQSDNTIQ